MDVIFADLPTRAWDVLSPRPPADAALEPRRGASQCAYELLRAFAGYAASMSITYTLGAGTLLGAMRNRPPGLLKWEHDVDVYVPASDAWTLLDALRTQCPSSSSRRRSRWCRTLQFRGLVDRHGDACCGFGFKLFHRRNDACELDVLVLGSSPAPYMHGETPLWPPWTLLLATPWHYLSTAWLRLTAAWTDTDDGTLYYVIPEDVWRKSLMASHSRWCSRVSEAWRWCGGPPLSFFHAEYFAPGDLLPVRHVHFHGLRLPIPHRPWVLLNRTYGFDCAYRARLNEHADAMADLRLPEHAHLLEPARVQLKARWRP